MKRVISAILVIAVTSVCDNFIEPAHAKYSGGSGTTNDPYRIANVNDLNTLANDTNDYNKCFIMTNDIDLAGYPFTTAVIAPDTNPSSWDFQGTPFSGIFDGAGHNITNLNINPSGQYHFGLFGKIDGGEIKNLHLRNVTISGSSSTHIGGLAGYNKGTVQYCSSQGNIFGDMYSGGLVGYNEGSISFSYSAGNVTAASFSGGLAGGIEGTYDKRGSISKSYSTSNVNCGNNAYELGGLVGHNYGSIRDCFSTGDVNVGNNSHEIGGFAGLSNYGSFYNCYSTGNVNAGSGSSTIGGFMGYGYGHSISHSYFLDTAGPNNGYGTPLTDSQMKLQASFVDWDFINIWKINEGIDYPKLAWQFIKYSGGSGEPNDPYQIANVADLLTLANDANDYNKCFIMTADIDLNSYSFTTAVIAPDTNTNVYFQGVPFTGVFDGAGHKIANLTIEPNGIRNDYLGFFGDVNRGEIKNLGLENVNISFGTYSYYVGGLVGESWASISNCYSTGSVGIQSSSSYYAGGLVGGNHSNIINCYSTASATSGNFSFYLGGLVGLNSNFGASISKCYSSGSVTAGSGSGDIGGLTGANYYGSISSSFFLNTAGPSNGYGTPLTDSQMKQQASFVGWDFNNVWKINEGVDYPKLVWQPKYSGGIGTTNDPYQIANSADLILLGSNTSDYDKYFIMTADINLISYTFTTAVIAKDNNPDYVFQGTVFTGVFDGAGHKITNLTIDTNGVGNYYLGLFGDINNGGEIKNLGLQNALVKGGQKYIGGLAGVNGDNGNIINCYSDGNISGTINIGGLLGTNNGNISNSHSTGSVNPGNYCGGLVGENTGTITNCFSSCEITNRVSHVVGGLVGHNYYGNINRSFSTGIVTGGDSRGGLVGVNNGYISNCFSTSIVSGETESSYLGGLVGFNPGDWRHPGTINIKYSYSTGSVPDGNFHGGLLGENVYGAILGSYFLDISGPNNGYGTPLTDAQMKQQASFVGWDFNDVWHICETTNYPKLLWQILPADFVCPDGVSFADYSFFAERWLDTNCASNNDCGGADFDLSGTVDLDDIDAFVQTWLFGL